MNIPATLPKRSNSIGFSARYERVMSSHRLQGFQDFLF